ncbi:ATP-dependent DNA helicase PIF1-like [Aphis craccivora]|uniref:ATP-dependent DNA helicase PIF1-like n=1 Tax=Aphis craccivora TaxID=307492 RepID=A0A6G0YE64_APHCR|nr:ATP-dependent DNA helicase PIF1-like [Aphis craccivora]
MPCLWKPPSRVSSENRLTGNSVGNGEGLGSDRCLAALARPTLVFIDVCLYEAIVITGCARGDIVIIPRITLIQTDYPFEFKIIKFPLEVCFDMSDMTINKFKGKSLSMAGIGLREMFFT